MSDFDPATEEFPVIRNRDGLKLFVKIITPTDRPVRGNAYLVHGYGDVHVGAHMRVATWVCVREGLRVIVFDATHGWAGRSEGSQDEATFYYHAEDLEDVMEWSRTQGWFERQFWLFGYSLGGLLAGTYAAAHAKQVRGLMLLAPVASGSLLKRRMPWPLRLWWRFRGRLTGIGRWSLPPWRFMDSGWNYDLQRVSGRLTMPVLVIVGSRDLFTRPKPLRRFVAGVRNADKTLVVLESIGHSFDKPATMGRLEMVLRPWLTKHLEKS
jgi:pimeloyl-ACP methyl ester carboxylesterase